MPAPKNTEPTLKSLYKSAGLDPNQVSGWADQEASLVGQYGDTRALLMTDRARMLQSFRQQKRDIKQQKGMDLSAAAGAANDRGVLGSSADVTARQDVISGAAAQRMAAKDAYSQGLIQNRSQLTQAQRDLMMGMSSLQGQRAAARSMAANNAYQQGLYDEFVKALKQNGGSTPGNTPGNGTTPAHLRGKWAQQLAGAKGMRGLANRIENLAGGLFDVDELLGHQDGVDPVHSGEGHYAGRAMDINTTRKNNTAFETAKLKRLSKVLNRLFQEQLALGVWNDPEGHPTHLHWEAQMRRWGRSPRQRKQDERGREEENRTER